MGSLVNSGGLESVKQVSETGAENRVVYEVSITALVEKGIEKGIQAMVSVLREYNIPDRDIVEKLQEKFKISQSEAKSYL